MKRLGSDRLRRRVEEAIRAGATGRLSLFVGDLDVSDRVLEEATEQGEGPPLTLSATLTGSLPRRLQGLPARADVEVEGVLIPRMRGAFSRTRPAPNGKTRLVSATAGALWESARWVPPRTL